MIDGDTVTVIVGGRQHYLVHSLLVLCSFNALSQSHWLYALRCLTFSSLMSTSAIIEYEQDRITTHRHREITEAQKRPLKKLMEHLESFILMD